MQSFSSVSFQNPDDENIAAGWQEILAKCQKSSHPIKRCTNQPPHLSIYLWAFCIGLSLASQNFPQAKKFDRVLIGFAFALPSPCIDNDRLIIIIIDCHGNKLLAFRGINANLLAGWRGRLLYYYLQWALQSIKTYPSIHPSLLLVVYVVVIRSSGLNISLMAYSWLNGIYLSNPSDQLSYASCQNNQFIPKPRPTARFLDNGKWKGNIIWQETKHIKTAQAFVYYGPICLFLL